MTWIFLSLKFPPPPPISRRGNHHHLHHRKSLLSSSRHKIQEMLLTVKQTNKTLSTWAV